MEGDMEGDMEAGDSKWESPQISRYHTRALGIDGTVVWKI